jgi:DNA-binding NtrC family response regulator
MPAYATAGAAVGASSPSPASPLTAGDESDDADFPDADLTPDDEADVQPEEPVAMAPVGSRLADVAKAAAMKAERTIIEDTLQQVHWNRRRAAEQLGVSYKTLLNKIKECGISRKS